MINDILCESCYLYDQCDRSNCIRNAKEKRDLKKTMMVMVSNKTSAKDMNNKLIAMCLVIAMCLSGCSDDVKKSDGVFKVVDGKEVFMNGENQIIDRLVTFEGEQYYIGEDGSKVKNNWAIIDNDGQYAYFGAKGIMIKDQRRLSIEKSI